MSHATVKAVQPVTSQYTDCNIQGPFANFISHIIAGNFDYMQHIYKMSFRVAISILKDLWFQHEREKVSTASTV
jgi:hypothetical protein